MWALLQVTGGRKAAGSRVVRQGLSGEEGRGQWIKNSLTSECCCTAETVQNIIIPFTHIMFLLMISIKRQKTSVVSQHPDYKLHSTTQNQSKKLLSTQEAGKGNRPCADIGGKEVLFLVNLFLIMIFTHDLDFP